MSLKDDKQQNIQIELDFSSARTGEARPAGRAETDSFGVTNGTESPANTNRLMEEVCERENLKEALRRVKANKGSAGVDGMTVGTILIPIRALNTGFVRSQVLGNALPFHWPVPPVLAAEE